MKGLCVHHRYKCHVGALLFSSSYTIQINLRNTLPPQQICFLLETKTQPALQLLSSLFFFLSFWEMIRRGHTVLVAPSEMASSIISVSFHIACNQCRVTREKRGSSEFHPFQTAQAEQSTTLSCIDTGTAHSDQRCLDFRYYSECHSYVPDDTAALLYYFQVPET